MAKTKKTPTKKQLKALEKARRAKARKRKQELRKKREEFVRPYYSEITGKRYKTEEGMKRAEAKIIAESSPPFDLIPKLILDAEDTLTRKYTNLGQQRNVWPHKSPGVMKTIFYNIQGNDWDFLYEGSIRKAYDEIGIDIKHKDGHTLREFITEIMGVEDTDEMVNENSDAEDIFEIEVDFS